MFLISHLEGAIIAFVYISNPIYCFAVILKLKAVFDRDFVFLKHTSKTIFDCDFVFLFDVLMLA